MKPLFLLLAAVMSVASAVAQDITTDPAGVRLMVDDVRLLADVLHSMDAGTDTLDVLESDYLLHASSGLRVYAERYGLTATSLASAIVRYPEAYADLDGLADAVLAQDSLFRTGFRRLQELFPGAAFPPIWFVAGDYGPGGLTRPEGAIVAAERFAARPEDIVPLVLHELAHFQQAMVQGVERYQRIYGPDQTLLALALRGGTAELVAELTAGRHTNTAAEAYGLAHEDELWQQFRGDMRDRDPGEWMFVRPSNPERPPDLGYWMGYRIARSYYDNAEHKQEALAELLNVRDYDAVLRNSGYAKP